ncbi:cell wall elongation regulator TseB-like domain-containing protein [Streptococcus cameli]
MAKLGKRYGSQSKKSVSMWTQVVFGLFVLAATVCFSILYILEKSAQPFELAREHAVTVAKQYAGVSEVSNVNIYNGLETYYTVRGKTDQQEDVYIFVPEESSNLYVFPVRDGISEQEAISIATEQGASDIDKTQVGIRDQEPIWEIKSGTTYYIIDFETGELLEKEGL